MRNRPAAPSREEGGYDQHLKKKTVLYKVFTNYFYTAAFRVLVPDQSFTSELNIKKLSSNNEERVQAWPKAALAFINRTDNNPVRINKHMNSESD